ncbi:MAG: alpha/beta hydrolase [Chloroflexota bacterium]
MTEPLVQTGQTFTSALGVTRYAAILPEGYGDSARNGRRYPVIYLLHGIGGHEDEWLQGSRIGEYAAGREVILVCADAARRCYVDSYDGTSPCETMAARDLVAFVDGTYRTIPRKEARGLMGLSMGGYGALYLSLRHSHTFHAAASLSGAFSIGMAPLGRLAPRLSQVNLLFPPSPFGRDQWDLFAQARAAPPSVQHGLHWKLLCGTEDSLIEINRAFHHYLLAAGIDHQYDEYPGAHEWPFWDAHAGECLDFLAQHLVGAG